MSSWLQLQVETTADSVERIEDCVMELGAVVVTLRDAHDDPVFEPELGTTPLWREVQLTALFNADMDQKLLLEQLQDQWPIGIPFLYQFNYLADENWERKWMDQFHAMRFGQQLYICPSWEKVEDPNAVIVELDPGLAFGTGTHPTTRLCLEWLADHPPVGLDVIDYGCGSGILAIAALKLGAKSVVGVDHDLQALTATAENATRNRITSEKLKIAVPEEKLNTKFDLILANILANPLCTLSSTFAELIKPDGKIILSGILKEQQDLIIAAYESWFEIIEIKAQDEWLRIVGKRV